MLAAPTDKSLACFSISSTGSPKVIPTLTRMIALWPGLMPTAGMIGSVLVDETDSPFRLVPGRHSIDNAVLWCCQEASLIFAFASPSLLLHLWSLPSGVFFPRQT